MASRHLFVDPELRKIVARPLGEVLGEEEAIRRAKACLGPVISVGDVVSTTLLRNGLSPKIVIFDDKTRREDSKPFPRELLRNFELFKVENPAGTISEEALILLKRLINQSGEFAVQVLGEEDLLGLPAIEEAPVGSLVFYGQPDSGIVVVRVNRESKGIARSILEKSRVPINGHRDS